MPGSRISDLFQMGVHILFHIAKTQVRHRSRKAYQAVHGFLLIA